MALPKRNTAIAIMLLAFVIIVPSFFMLTQIKHEQAPYDQLAIINKTQVKVILTTGQTYLSPSILSSTTQTLEALDIFDIVKKAAWLGQTLPTTQLSWQYKGQTLVYMQILGPYNGEYHVEFSKCTISEIAINCNGQIINFGVAATNPDEGFAFIWLNSDQI